MITMEINHWIALPTVSFVQPRAWYTIWLSCSCSSDVLFQFLLTVVFWDTWNATIYYHMQILSSSAKSGEWTLSDELLLMNDTWNWLGINYLYFIATDSVQQKLDSLEHSDIVNIQWRLYIIDLHEFCSLCFKISELNERGKGLIF